MDGDRRARIAVRVAFAAVALSLPLLLVVKDRSGETYPGLFEPTFDHAPDSGTLVKEVLPRVSVVDVAGRRYSVPITQLETPGAWPDLPKRIIVTAFKRPQELRTAESRRWLTQRFIDLGIDQPASMTVQWYATWRDVHRPHTIVRTRNYQSYDVRLDGRS